MEQSEKKSTRCNGSKYSKEFRIKVCQEYLNGKENKVFLESKYQLGHGRILYWLKELGYIALDMKMAYMQPKENPTEESLPNDNKRIKELEKELENARLQAEAYRLMIEVAEKELQIKIRKK